MNMFTRKLCVSVAFCLSIFSSHSALASFPSVTLEDSFEGGAVDLTNWIVSLPFSDSSVIPNDGSVTLNNNGQIAATTTVKAPYTIVLEDVSMSSWEVLSITIRSDGFIPPGQEVAPGIRFNFWNHNGHAGAFFYPAGIEGGEGLSSGTFSKSSTYKIKITDDGYNFILWVNDALIFSGESSLSAGNKITIFNRGTQTGWAIPSSTTIGSVRITQDGPTDSDGDGSIDYREDKDGTDPSNSNSFNPLSKGLVAYYPFDGNANDESGYGNSGTLDGAVLTAGRHGVPGTAYFFDGIDDEVAIQPAEPLTGIEGAVTVTAWIYNEGLGAPTYGSQDLQGIFGPATYLAWDSDGGFGLRLYDGNHDSVNSRRYSFTVGAPRQDLDSASIAPEDRWDFVVASYDGNTMRIFRNGLLDASQVVGPGLTRGMNYGGNYFTIGQFVDWSAGTQRCPFHGKIDDVRVYNRALNEAEVGQLYQTDAGNLDSDGDGLSDAWERGYGRYQVIQGNFTWEEAKADAESRGGHLATITSASENDFISTIDTQLAAGWGAGGACWIGGTDAETEGVWRWVTGEAYVYSSWWNTNVGVEPDNYLGSQHWMITHFGGVNLWGDANHDDPNISAYILEYGYPTDPLNADSDDDGFNDSIETHYKTDPNNATVTPNNSRPTGKVFAWGDNTLGECNVPTPSPDAIQVAAGSSDSVVVKADGSLQSWGAMLNQSLQHIPSYAPSDLAGVVQIESGFDYKIALKGDGTVAVWGWMWDGYQHIPAPPATDVTGVVQVAAGASHYTLLKADGTVESRGSSNWGALDVPGDLTDVVKVAAGAYHSVALKRDGSLVLWGQSNHPVVYQIPVGLNGVIDIAAGDHFTVALKADGTVQGWGLNNVGQLNVPADLGNIVGISASLVAGHALALTADGTVVAWGDNSLGQADVPEGLSGVFALAAAGGHSLVLFNAPDTDGDGIPDAYETNTGVYVSPTNTGTDPNKADTDGDGLPDGVETASYIYIDATDTGTDPNVADSDADGLNDGVETNTGVFGGPSDTGSNPLEADTSGDGLLDGDVVSAGYNPNTSYTALFNLIKTKGTATQETIGLFSEDAMMDLNLGGVTLRKSGGTVNLRLQIQSKTDLKAPHWTDEGTETFILDMPGNKAIMRIRALGPQ